jgi:hypothetical protein
MGRLKSDKVNCSASFVFDAVPEDHLKKRKGSACSRRQGAPKDVPDKLHGETLKAWRCRRSCAFHCIQTGVQLTTG